MEIKRKIKMSAKTDRRLIIRYPKNTEQIDCAECDSKMLKAEKVAALFDIKQREIFRAIENGTVHFFETETSSVLICLSTAAAVVNQKLLVSDVEDK